MTLLRSNFRTEFDAQNEGNGVSGLQISKIFQGGHAPGPPRLRAASSFWDYATVRFLAGSAPVCTVGMLFYNKHTCRFGESGIGCLVFITCHFGKIL